MAGLNASYGSELHLLRMLGRHRQYFDWLVLNETAAHRVEWLDFPSGDRRLDKQGDASWDREWHQLNFLPDADPAKTAWGNAWPKLGPNWDAVGRLCYRDGTDDWLLVEAKANFEELSSSCQAQQESLTQIRQALDATKEALGVPIDLDWTNGFYQFCNRLTALHVMNSNDTPAGLLYVYFYGDKGGSDDGWTRICPTSAAAWGEAPDRQSAHVGLPSGHILEGRVHKLFVDVRCSGDEREPSGEPVPYYVEDGLKKDARL